MDCIIYYTKLHINIAILAFLCMFFGMKIEIKWPHSIPDRTFWYNHDRYKSAHRLGGIIHSSLNQINIYAIYRNKNLIHQTTFRAVTLLSVVTRITYAPWLGKEIERFWSDAIIERINNPFEL